MKQAHHLIIINCILIIQIFNFLLELKVCIINNELSLYLITHFITIIIIIIILILSSDNFSDRGKRKNTNILDDLEGF